MWIWLHTVDYTCMAYCDHFHKDDAHSYDDIGDHCDDHCEAVEQVVEDVDDNQMI